MQNKIINKTILNTGILMLVFVFLDILVTTIFQFVNIPMTKANIFLAAILDIIVVATLQKKNKTEWNLKSYIISVSFAISLILISTLFIGKTYDTTADGNFYHKPAVGLIKDGWNPVYQTTQEFIDQTGSDVKDVGELRWIDHYPKATWNFAASVYSVTGRIESGKVITVIAMFSISFITYAYLSDRLLKKWQACLIAIAISINPIVLAQIFSYYVDGTMGLFIYGMIIFMIMLEDDKFQLINMKEKWTYLTAAMTICMNIKFTGVYFAGIFSIVFYIYWIWKNRKNLKEYIVPVTTKFALIVVLSIGIVGGSTYIKNIITNKNPLYPLLGEGKVDIVTTMQPASFEHKGRLHKLLESLFAKTENITYSSGIDPTIKIPFSIEGKEIEAIAIPDTRIAGFGILFSGIMIIAVIIIIYSLINIFKINKYMFRCICLILLAITISTIGLAEAWWARYSPQIYLLVLIALFIIFYVANNTKKQLKMVIANTAGIIAFAIMMINASLFIHWKVEDILVSEKISIGLNEMTNTELIDIAFTGTKSYGLIYNLRDKNINYNIVEKNDETMKKYIYNYQLMY